MEIGSEFHLRLESLKEADFSIYHLLKDYNALYLDSGRSALRLILNNINRGEVLVPEYICDSVINCFTGFEIKCYRLKPDLEIDMEDLCNKISPSTKIVFLMHYFGALQREEVCLQLQELRNQKGFMIIEDTTHSIFSSPITVGDYCICSLRKWFAIPDGGVLYSTHSLQRWKNLNLNRNRSIEKAYGMILKTLYLDGELKSNSIFRKIFESTENKLNCKKEVLKISSLSEYLLQCYDLSTMISKRKENYHQLLNGIWVSGFSPIQTLQKTDCPFTLPIRLNNRDQFRKYLINHKIFCAVHWPLEKNILNKMKRAKQLSLEIISFPIDQRYHTDEIDYLIKVINQYERRRMDAGNHSP
ncbi:MULTISPECIES: DegT/DnrJ/EryC1/StrS family aminotransferase [Bacillaceae]|uniref:DegT/DnrJ/EryC1/StrS family aminotransferase n=1 Tax=Evansella alkalicola TaxID=745819 RepID=A0ABS6JXY2_9BACI|nr:MULTISPECIES: DegT/DnrJ/EryC1/StrS family aminotransferase [Bacillaceae]MBU9723458.1 DegT/DnrJ/EryC1/StrS family aminotransferase [Bacillus alkalicola]